MNVTPAQLAALRIPAHTAEITIPAPWATIKEDTMTENTPAEPVASQAVAPVPRERITNEIDEWLEIETREGGYSYLHMGCGHTMNLDPKTRAALAAYLAGAENTSAAEPLARTLLAVPEGYGAPHHDAGRIKPDDYVLQVDESGYIRAGRAHHQNEDGRWYTQNGLCITWPIERADRPDAVTVWPAPTPPAVEVEMPTEHPAHLLDVEDANGDVCAYMALSNDGKWVGVDQNGNPRVRWTRRLTAFTLPDGTRARRDGERPDGTPRFVKTQEEA